MSNLSGFLMFSALSIIEVDGPVKASGRTQFEISEGVAVVTSQTPSVSVRKNKKIDIGSSKGIDI